ncbi:sugar kinase [Algoriphagus aestuarii]|nr:sugar kinase [Algoriphagus aestuarii]
MKKRIVTLGEVLLRLSTPSHYRFIKSNTFESEYGGAEANVAVSLAMMGCSTAHVTALPENDLGIVAKKSLQFHGVDTSYVYHDAGRMGLYFVENGSMQRSSKIIYDRFDSVFAQYDFANLDWEKIFEGADWFHWTGITPAISASAAAVCKEAILAAGKMNIKISADINYRRNLWQYGKSPLEVMPELIEPSHLIIAGLTDFENCMGIESNDFEAACMQAKARCPNLHYVSTTSRKSVSASHNKLKGKLWNGTELIKTKSYQMTHIVDRIGGGDAFMAGLIYGLLHFEDQEAINFALAASVLKHSIPGDANLVTLEEVKQLLSGENIGKLLR